MSWLDRFTTLFRQQRLHDELDEELASHISEAIEHGRSPAEARKAFGSTLQHREHSRDFKLIPWLDALAADVVFGWRQLAKNRSASAAAILSLALATGAATAAFRLVDALLLRPLPVAEPGRLFYIASYDDISSYRDDYDYPTFRKFRSQLAGVADLMLVGGTAPGQVLYPGSEEPEKIFRQFVSGNVFGIFGLRPAAGRLLTETDDDAPGAHAVAVLSYDYWSRRFSRDPAAIGKTFRAGDRVYEIIGVGPKGFTGTEPGVVNDIFIPSMMNVGALDSPGWSWFRTWVRPKPGVTPAEIAQRLQPDKPLPKFGFHVLPAAAGASDRQRELRRPLAILAVLVALILLMACANVGNLLAAQAASRAREMALRVSIGAGKGRLIQLVLVESALLAAIASIGGAAFSSWAAPFVVTMLAPTGDAMRLVMDFDWRTLAFGSALTATVSLLFGLVPALHASTIQPIQALKGAAPHARRGFMHTLVTLQVAFCVMILFVAGLFVSTFERLSHRALGFSSQGLLILETQVRGKPMTIDAWTRIADRLRQEPGVASAALAGWVPLSGNRWTGTVRTPDRQETPPVYVLDISPNYFTTMNIGQIGGRDFRTGDAQPKLTDARAPTAGVGIVNEAFARAYFNGANPVGRTVSMAVSQSQFAPLEIVGYVRDSVYSSVRETVPPTVFVPVETRSGGALVVRAASTLARTLRRELQTQPGMLVGNVDTQSAIVLRQMIRERLLAALSFFFAVIALILAAVGLYGVLNYSVIQSRREIGIRLALGAGAGQVVHRLTTGILALVVAGLSIGLLAGLASQRLFHSLLYEVKATDPMMIAAPLLTLLCAAMLAALPPAIRAVKIDPVETLRNE